MSIIRIVKMTFREEGTAAFVNLFEERKNTIRSFKGCEHVELWRYEKNPNVFFTYSIWENEEYLDHYRFSDFFKDTWSITRALFADKAEAWTLNKVGNEGIPLPTTD